MQQGHFYFVPANDPEEALTKIIGIVSSRIPKKFGFNPVKEIQVLCPMNRGGVGARSINLELQRKLNPSLGLKVERFGFTYRLGDEVMQIQNDYEKEIYNGDIGFVEDINPDASKITLRYEGRSIPYDFGELDQVNLAYATTIHKTQGSEYPCVVIPVICDAKSETSVYGDDSWKNLVVLVGQKKAVFMCARDFKAKKRHTKLKEWLLEKTPKLDLT